MKTNNFFHLIMLLALIITSCTSEKDSYLSWNLNGDVKSVNTYSSVRKFGKLEKDKLDSRCEFTEKGKLRIMEHIGYSKTIYKYEGDLVVEMEHYDLQPGKGLEYKSIYKYEENKNTETCTFNSNGVLEGKTVHKFDGDKVIEAIDYDADGSLKEKSVNKYEEDRIVESINYDADGTIKVKITYKYHKNGKLMYLDDIFFNKDGSINLRLYHKYDEHGNIIESGDENGINKRNEFKYDVNGNLIESTSFKEDGSSEKFIYTNDEHGNWIEKIPVDDSSKLNGEIREIEYY